ncbi:hypothetical protein AOLI_G00040610 [Acnodon oligacanthus]
MAKRSSGYFIRSAEEVHEEGHAQEEDGESAADGGDVAVLQKLTVSSRDSNPEHLAERTIRMNSTCDSSSCVLLTEDDSVGVHLNGITCTYYPAQLTRD